ncbi:DNA polymerase/3'-5' exonuclease PolX [bacterium]|nr:DNA polymerase/3'-5' exonuclease PolX [bacterium]
MINNKIADIFQEIGDILEIQNENPFRVRSYHRAAQIIHNLAGDLKSAYETDPKKIMVIRGVGKDLFSMIEEIIKTGDCSLHKDLLAHFHPGLLDMLHLRGIGPKKVKLIYMNLGIKDIKALEESANEGKLRSLPGMGEKTEQAIIKSIADMKRYSQRSLMPLALDEAKLVISYINEHKNVSKCEYAGSLRRRKETIGDIDILVTTKSATKPIMDHFINYPHMDEILAHGPTKSSIVLNSGIQVDLRVIEEESFGAAMHYFTGSKAHNIAIRDRAKKKGLKVNEYGVFKGRKNLASKTEEDVFKAIGLPFIIPELRKNDGEIEAAEKGKLPKSIELKDIKGDLHMHTNASDGSEPLGKVVKYCYEAGYEYIAITDHSKSSHIANGLDEKRLLNQYKEIDKLNKLYKDKNFKIFKGSEVDILSDGSLDFSDEILSQMDIFPASVHSKFSMSEKDMTKRIIKAIKNPYVKMIGHPTGRLINRREPYKLNIEAVIDAAIEYNTTLELNCQPTRLDLTDKYLRRAKEKGAKIVINTDSHHTSQRAYMQYGIYIARRGWLEKGDVLNTMPLGKLIKFLNKTKS